MDRITQGGGLSRADVMADPRSNPPIRPAPPPDEDSLNLLDGPDEPTDDTPTVISKMPQPPVASRPDDHLSGGLRGRRLAHFELIEPIGVGGMAAVLRARDTQLDRLVALKILPPEMASDAENVRRFHQEARSAAKLDHENIARVFFCGEDQRLHFIAFEFVEGDNLRTILEKRGRLPAGEALHYMLQVAAGLAHAARRGVVHRDIKPSNIIVTPNGRAKLVDMGLARSLEPQHDQGLTQSGVTLGTFDYISPEQALEPREADVRSDIYSLGCTFYHVLTGQPPVPEGTAMKKMHHHQYVKPPDPRQFVPDLPDEVAVILDRMMAKQAKDRYQTPEQLVHHLYLAARKLGADAEVPEGVLAVEAALPHPPSGRPLVLATLAAVVVVGLIFFLDQSPAPNVEPVTPAPATADNDTPKEPSRSQTATQTTSPSGDRTIPTLVNPSPDKKSVAYYQADKPTAADLAEFLKQHRDYAEIVIELAGDLDLRGDERGPDLVLSNPKVTIHPRDASIRPTILFGYHHVPSTALQAPLTVTARDSCTVEGIRFVLIQSGANVPMTALRLRNIRQATVRRCEFIQALPNKEQQGRMASVLVESDKPASLLLSECAFLGFGSISLAGDGGTGRPKEFTEVVAGGHDAVTRLGPVRIEASNCAFGPHAALFRLEGAAADPDGLVRLTHCSVLAAGQSAVCDVVDGAGAAVEAEFSVFSHPGEPSMTGMAEGKGAVLLRQASATSSVRFTGRRNRYHQLDALWVVAGKMQEPDEESWKDKDSRWMGEESPWKEAQPLSKLERLAGEERPAIKSAFQVNPLAPELRVPARERAFGQILGAERVLAFSYLDKLPDLKDDPAAPAGQRKLIVEKRPASDPEQLAYPTLGHALLDARPGDLILLRLDGEVKLDPISLSGDNLAELTIRAARGFHPILTLSSREVEASLFRVHYGKLRLEGIEIRLQPDRDAFESQAVVSFLGDGECVLKDCIITLDRAGRKTALAAAVLAEPGKLMKKAEAPPARSRDQGPRFALENCLVRGHGDLVASQGGQPAEVSVRNSFVALTGSLLAVEGSKDMPAPSGVLAVQLRKVTTYLGGNLIRLRAARDLKSLARIQCEPDECLFVPASADGVLVHLEGPEGEEQGLPLKLDWTPGTNAYGNFGTLLEQQASGGMKMPQPANLSAWKKISNEMDSFYNVKPLELPAADASFAQLLPSSIRPPEKQKDFGADLPPLRGKSEIAPPRAEVPESDLD